VFHIVQEALSNVARHAAAHHAWLHITPVPSRPDWVEVRVEDDGTGLPSPGPDGVGGASGHTHHGLAIMQERARRMGGTLDFSARPGGGTVVRLAFAAQPAVAAPAVPMAAQTVVVH
jgi:nitrate/nitrite-specific signal transduction histidine kinase